jgi:segregation and condensation protein B
VSENENDVSPVEPGETMPGAGAGVCDTVEAAPASGPDVFGEPVVDPAVGGVPAEPADLVEAPSEPPVDTQLKAIVEALIFASPEPLSLKALAKVLEGETPEAIERAVAALAQDYAGEGGLQLLEVAGGLQIVTRPDLHEWVRRLFHERTTQKLSVAALETLAVIAYKQPITAAEVAEIRGVNTAGVLGTLLDRKLIKIVGRKPVVGRPFMYATTREFLNRFGLRDLNDLPRVEDMADALGFEPPLLDEVVAPPALPFDAEPAETVALPSADAPGDPR